MKRILKFLMLFSFVCALACFAISCNDKEKYTVNYYVDLDLYCTIKSDSPLMELPPPPTVRGYVFNDWRVRGGERDGEHFEPSYLFSLYEEYNTTEINIEADMHRGVIISFHTDTSEEIPDITVGWGSSIKELPQPTPPKGKTFAAWYSSPEFQKPNEVTIKHSMYETTTLYACFAGETSKVTYKFNVQGQEDKVITVTTGKTVSYFVPEFENPGYKFEWWYYDQKFTEIWNRNDDIKNDTVLYAKWREYEEPSA